MKQTSPSNTNAPGLSPRSDVPYGSNDFRLSPREWLVAGAIAAAAFWLVPIVWQRIEPLEAGPDFRIAYLDSEHGLSEDYWIWQRWCREACRRDDVLVVGDSVVRGYYVYADQTLSHYLTELSGKEPAQGKEFANLGVDQAYPLALAGLLEYYGRALAGKQVLLCYNPLWMKSDEADLKTAKQVGNHSRLIPQFFPRVPSYHEPLEGRLGAVVGRDLPLAAWTNHLRLAYFQSRDFAAWTRAHPYANPLRAITRELPSPYEPPEDAEATPWTTKGIEPYNLSWVDLDGSLQWAAFRRAIEVLQGRGNRVFVLVGPFNEHMLTEPSLAAYEKMKGGVAGWLEDHGIRALRPAGAAQRALRRRQPPPGRRLPAACQGTAGQRGIRAIHDRAMRSCQRRLCPGKTGGLTGPLRRDSLSGAMFQGDCTHDY